ncbi:hypothetical protein M0805_001996 [Coniferiporia weirii]|nr:hypothetical protein M0805_001996 [Coniferiporia weirii]
MLSTVHASSSRQFLSVPPLLRAPFRARHGRCHPTGPAALASRSVSSTPTKYQDADASHPVDAEHGTTAATPVDVIDLLQKMKEKEKEAPSLDGTIAAPPSANSHFKSALASGLRKNKNTGGPKARSASPPAKKSRPPKDPGISKRRKKLERDTAALAELVSEAGTFKPGSGLKPESWKSDWGKDELRPKYEAMRRERRPYHPRPELAPKYGKARHEERRRPPHFPQKLPPYVRRVEGLIEASVKDVLEDVEPPTERAPIASLAHGLDRVLFNPGVHWLRDPRSRVHNFTPYIQRIPDIKDFAFERLTPFVQSSRDSVMRELAAAKGKRFAGSTSSLSGLLSHIYFLISQDHPVNTNSLVKPFSRSPNNFTPGQRMPTAVVFNHQDGVYMIDSDSTDNDDSQWNVLMWMGTMLENFFTLPKDKFKKLMRSLSPEDTAEKPVEAYRYAQSNAFIMRSQLDSHDPRLPGTGVFDIKTRAALPLRLDKMNFKENSGYMIKSQHGVLESFDREYYDMIRAAFLKYSFQARIGNMDGVFVAYHNTARVFGFQYISLEEMDECLFGAKDRGWRVFDKCVSLLETLAGEITSCFPGKSITCLAETFEGSGVMRVWVQPVEGELEAGTLPEISPESSNPIIQLDVAVDSYLNGERVGGQTAVNQPESPWTLHWSISRSAEPSEIVWKNFEKAKQRKYRPALYPTGVNSDNLEDFFKGLGFGNIEFMPDKAHFIEADFGAEALRQISRAGQIETERLESEEKLKGIQIWQQTAFPDPDYHHTLEPLTRSEDGEVASCLEDTPSENEMPSQEDMPSKENTSEESTSDVLSDSEPNDDFHAASESGP